ncbi:MAG: HAD family hydrolase [Anaerolineales bacterium]
MAHPIKAVLFDLDDTLFDHHHSMQAGLLAMQQAYPGLQRWPLQDLTNTYVELLESLHVQVLQGLLTPEQARIQRIQRFFLKYDQRLSLDAIPDSVILYRDAYQAARRVVPGALALLEYVHARAQTGVITNNTSLEQREKLDTYGLMPWMDVVVISEEVGVTKPDPAIFNIALERLDCSPAQAVMLGDSWEVDVLGARQAGIRPVWFNRFGSPRPDESVTMIDALEPAQAIAELLLTQ